MNHKKQETNGIIYSIWLIVFFLCTFGLIVVYSASINGSNYSNAIFNKQLIYIIAGLVVGSLIQFLDYKILDLNSYLLKFFL